MVQYYVQLRAQPALRTPARRLASGAHGTAGVVARTPLCSMRAAPAPPQGTRHSSGAGRCALLLLVLVQRALARRSCSARCSQSSALVVGVVVRGGAAARGTAVVLVRGTVLLAFLLVLTRSGQCLVMADDPHVVVCLTRRKEPLRQWWYNVRRTAGARPRCLLRAAAPGGCRITGQTCRHTAH